MKAQRHPAKLNPEQATWPEEPTPIEPDKNEAAPPAQEPAAPDFSKEQPPADDPDALVADPWALQKVSRVSAQKIVLAAQGGHAERSETGLWCVGLPTLLHLGYDRALAVRWLEEAQPHGCDPTLEGGVVVARSGRGWVTVRSMAVHPREAMFLAAVREPCALRCGDEVAVRMAPDGTREVVHGR